MTDKSPIQQAIEKLISLKDSTNRECRIQAFDEAIGVIKSLLPTEKEFAGKVFDAGATYGSNDMGFSCDRVTRAGWENTPDKEEFLNRYYKP